MKRITSIALALVFCAIGQADEVYVLSLNTSSLVSNSSGPFALDFQLTSGDTTTGVVNTAALSQFDFGAGGSFGSGSPFANSGNASGSLSLTVGLTTSSGTFFSEFSQYFIPGSILTFHFDLTNNAQPGSTPDEFTFQFIDSSGGEVSTTDPSGSNSLVVIDLTGQALQPQIYAANGDGVNIAPAVTNATSPEPTTAVLLLCSGAFIAARWKITRRPVEFRQRFARRPSA